MSYSKEWLVLYRNTYVHLWKITRSFLPRMRNFLDISCRENKNTCFRFKNFLPENINFYKITCKTYSTNREATDDNKIRRIRFAWWISKATDSHTEYVTLIAFQRQQWLLWTRLCVMFIRKFSVLYCKIRRIKCTSIPQLTVNCFGFIFFWVRLV